MNLVEAIFRAVLEISWRASWLVLAVLALRALLRGRLPARVVFWVWIAVAIRLLLPFAFPVAWSPFNFAPLSHRSDSALNHPSPAISLAPVVAEGPSLASSTSSALSAIRLSSREKLTPFQWAAAIWIAGVFALSLVRFWAYVGFVRALRRSRITPSPALTQLLASSAGESGLARIKVSVTNLVRAPALHGILQPELLFPPGFVEKLTPRELQLIVAHELAHAQRRDLLAQVLIHGAAILHWFNPLVWIAARTARADCELACDEFVLRRLTAVEREAYGATLLRIISLAHCGAPPPLGLGVVESKLQIKRRIQMIVTQPSPTVVRTMLGCALFALVTGLSLTAETSAQPAPAVTESRVEPPHKVMAGPDPSQWKFTYDATTDRLDTLFPNGVVATVGDRRITVTDVRRELKPLVPLLQRDAHDQGDFNLRLNQLENSVVKDLVARVLYIKEFHAPRPGEEAKHIPSEYIDNTIADRLHDQFEGDRTKLLAYLQSRGVTLAEYRHEIEEEIIYHYMIGQERQLNGKADAKKDPRDGAPGQVHLQLIQLKRTADTTDAALLERANAILARRKAGESFYALAREFDEDTRRDKGGDWGWQSPGDLKADYSEKLFALKKGEVSEPIITKEGCFLLYAEDRK